MIQTAFKAQNVFLLNDEPDWSSPVESDFAIARDTQISLTRRESRRPYSATLLTKLTYTSSVRRTSLRTLMGALRQLNTQPVIVPFWPAISYWANRATAPINGGLRIAWRADWSQFGIYAATDAEPGWPAGADFWAPALMGFLNADSSPAIRRDALSFKVNFVESSLAAYALLAQAAAPAGHAIQDTGSNNITDTGGNDILGF
jgi:hypothetical protein